MYTLWLSSKIGLTNKYSEPCVGWNNSHQFPSAGTACSFMEHTKRQTSNRSTRGPSKAKKDLCPRWYRMVKICNEDNARCELMWLDCRWQWMVNKDRLVYWMLSTEHPFALPHTNHPYNTHSNQNPHSLNHTKTYSSTPNVHCSEQCDVWLFSSNS